MSKCQAKVEKTVSRPIWGVTKKLENCPNDAKGKGIFCEAHGCFDCSLKSAEVCWEYEGMKLCIACRGKRKFEKKAEEEKKKKIIEEGRKAFRKKKEEVEEQERLRKETEEEQERLRKETEEEQERLRKETEEERERERENLKKLPNWDLLAASQKQDFLNQVSLLDQTQFSNLHNQVQQAIKKAQEEQALRQAKTLAVQEINQFLRADPHLDSAALGGVNANWESEINQASSIKLVKQIKDRVWAAITAKKAEKNSEKQLVNLISEAQGSMNSNLLDKLQKDLEKINVYRNQPVFQKQKKAVEVLENYLFSANLTKYREFIVNSLQKELASEPFPVLAEELKEPNRDFVLQINQITDQPALENIKNQVLNNVGEKKAEKLVNNLLVKIKATFTSEAERSAVCQGIYRLRDHGNNWEKNLWASHRDVFEAFLKGEKKEDSSNYNHSSNKSNYLLPILAVLLISGMFITGFLLVGWRSKLKR